MLALHVLETCYNLFPSYTGSFRQFLSGGALSPRQRYFCIMTRRYKNESEYVISEGEAFVVPEPRRFFKHLYAAFPALQERDYRLYFTGQLVSQVGNWLQTVALGWQVLQLTHSAFWVGIVSAIGGLPVLVFVLFGGVIVDRFPKKTILYITQILPMVFAFILGVRTLTGGITIPEICVLAFLLGLVNAVDLPARHAYVAEMMRQPGRMAPTTEGRTRGARLASAIALNSATVNISRVLGPAVAGALIASIGMGGTYIINAVSFGGVILSLWLIAFREPRPEAHHLHPLKAIAEGVSYAFGRPDIRLFMLASGITSIFGWSYVSILPVIIDQVFHRDAAALGYFFSAIGVGALTAVLLVSLYLDRAGVRTFVIGGSALLGCSLLALAYIERYELALIFAAFSGCALISQFSVINTTIQRSVKDAIRGRVMSIAVLMFRGVGPIGSFIMGSLAEHFGTQRALLIGAAAVLAVASVLFMRQRDMPLAGGVIEN